MDGGTGHVSTQVESPNRWLPTTGHRSSPDPWRRVVEETVPIRDRELRIIRPMDGIMLLDEAAFEQDQYLPYWAQLWPSGIALAQVVAGNAKKRGGLAGAHVLEIGCGLGLPSITAALVGARVLATDWSADAIDFVSANANRNSARLDVAVCAWTAPGRIVEQGPWDVVLASDVLYEWRNADHLLDLLPRLVDRMGEVWLADPGRGPAKVLLDTVAGEWGCTEFSEAAWEGASVWRIVPHRATPKRCAADTPPSRRP